MKLSDFHYDLPPELIARYPLERRSASRLLHLNKNSGEVVHRVFTDIVDCISHNDLLICNNTKVIAARLWGQKASGGKVEVLVERILDEHRVLAHVRASKSPKLGSKILLGENIEFEMLGRREDLFELKCLDPRPVLEVIEQIGEVPLPPYFQREPEESDKERYQTIFAKHDGSVAAPTAGLHFDPELLNKIKAKIMFVTLHVGAGTFAPIRVEDITQHKMHSEWLDVSSEVCQQIRETKAKGGRVIAVGTTAARSLETAAKTVEIQPFSGQTNIFIYPGFEFKCVDALITNFHLPASTLMLLVSAFAGHKNIMAAYVEAVAEKYRFFSYGDAMFIE